MRNNQLLDNNSASTFPWQRIDAESDELFEMEIYIRFASKLQNRRYSQLQFSSQQSSEEFSSVQEQRQSSRQDGSEVTARAQNENKETRLLFVCYTCRLLFVCYTCRLAKQIVVARLRKGRIKRSVKRASTNY
jgi:hypothetical protein